MNRDLTVACALMATGLIWLGVRIWGWYEDAKRRDELDRAAAIANQQRHRPHPSAAGVLFCARCPAMRVGSQDRHVAWTGMADDIEIRAWDCGCGHANTFRVIAPTTPRRGK